MKRSIQFFLSTLLMLGGFISNAQNKLTLQQAVETGIANNALVQQRDLQSDREELAWKQAKLNRFPDLNAFVRHGANQGRSIDPFTNTYVNEKVIFASYGIGSSVTLFNGMSITNSVKQTNLAWKASEMEFQQQKDEITVNIILAYLQVLNNEELLNEARAQEVLSKRQVERLELLNKEGAILPSQLSDLRGQFANDQLSIINAENALESSKIVLSQLMNVPYDKNMELEKLGSESFAARYGETVEAIFTNSQSQFALVKAASLRTQSAASLVKARKGALYPTLSLNGNLNTNYSSAAMQSFLVNTTTFTSGDFVMVNGTPSPVIKQQSNFRSEKIGYGKQLDNNVFTTVSLDLQIPIFNSLFRRNQVKLAKIDLRNSQVVEKSINIQLKQDIEQAYLNMNTAFDRYKTLLEQVEAFRESFRSAEIRFTEGVGNSVEYLIAKNNYDRANINLISAKYDYVLRTKILDYYQGKKLF